MLKCYWCFQSFYVPVFLMVLLIMCRGCLPRTARDKSAGYAALISGEQE